MTIRRLESCRLNFVNLYFHLQGEICISFMKQELKCVCFIKAAISAEHFPVR